MATVKKLAGELGVADRITFAGSVPHVEVARFYAAADVFAFPSLKEAGGNVVLEAMSHGLPVIVVDHGGPATTVTPDCGYKLPPTSVEAVVAGIAEAIKALAASPRDTPTDGRGGAQENSRRIPVGGQGAPHDGHLRRGYRARGGKGEEPWIGDSGIPRSARRSSPARP